MRRWRRPTPIPGDCGDEYRRPPFLTASGDLSHHLDGLPTVYRGRAGRRGGRAGCAVDSGSVWEPIAGYSRAVRVGDRILVSGTTATHGSGEIVCPGDPAGQTIFILDKIAREPERARRPRSRTSCAPASICSDADEWEPVSRVHGRVFGDIRPANTLLEVGRLVGDYVVEIEAEAVLDTAGPARD